jgi:hypothetical protein
MTAQRLEKWLKAGADEAEQDLTINFHLAGPAGTVLTSACHQYDMGQAEGGWSGRRDSESTTLWPLSQQSPSVEFEASLRYTVDFCASLLASDAPDASHHPGRHRLRSKRLPPRPRQPIAKTDGKQCISKRRRHRLTPRRYPLTDKRRCRYVSTHHESSTKHLPTDTEPPTTSARFFGYNHRRLRSLLRLETRQSPYNHIGWS